MLCLLLAACATVPPVAEVAPAKGPAVPAVVGASGPLTPHQAQAVLQRLEAQAPDAGALERHLAVEQAVAETPLFAGNRVQILNDGAQSFPAIFSAIRSARHFVHLEYYILEDVSWDHQSLADLLVSRSQAGVEVDVIYDAVGSLGTSNSFFDRLRAAGVRVVEFNPLSPWGPFHHSVNDRDHRKILVVDGTEAIIGGVNLSSTYESASAGTGRNEPWHDTDVSIEGPVVQQIDGLFRGHWSAQGGAAFEDADPPPAAPSDGHEVVRVIGSAPRHQVSRYYVTELSAIRNAERSVWVTTAYFVPTRQEKRDLIDAARRGVDVRLLLPSHSDSSAALAVQHSEYTDLLQAGVRIYERDDGILHTKAMVIDGVYSTIGSSNFDHRSVLFNDEVDAVMLGAATGQQFEALYQAGLEHAHEIDLASWRKRSFTEKTRERFWRLWQVLL